MNVEWHTQNRLCRNASLEQRVQWHLAHVEACDCRGLPASIVAELRHSDEERLRHSDEERLRHSDEERRAPDAGAPAAS